MATVSVTTTNDLVDGTTSSIANLIASPGADGKISLPEAIVAANNTAGADAIDLTGVSGTITLASSLSINNSVSIDGLGASNLSVSGNNAVRVFDISGSGVTVNISDMTITQGSVTGRGANISVTNGSTLTLNNSTVSNGTASGTFPNGKAGGILIDNSSNVTVTNSTISGNTSNENGAGIYNRSGTLTVINSTVTNNYTNNTGGGGIDNRGIATVSNSTISGNSASNNGGGIYNVNSTATLTVTNSTIANNTVNLRGGGISNFSNGTATIANSTISGNTAPNGGGIRNTGTMTVTNSTISGNTATDNGGGIYNVNATTLTITNSTLAYNSASNGGGISNASSTATVSNSIVAGNTATTNTEVQNLDTFTSNGNNLVGQSGSAGSFPTVASDITVSGLISTVLSPLANNGGLTQTHALLASSQAIDAGSNTLASGLTSDQRGLPFTRISNSTVDIGAFEYRATPPEVDLSVVKTAPATANPGGSISYTITVTNNSTTNTIDHLNLSDTVPAAVTNPSFSASAGNYSNTSGVWEKVNLAPSQSATLTVNGTIDSATPAGTIVTNTATVKPNPILSGLTALGITDSVTTNDSSTANTLIQGIVNLSVSSNAGTEAGTTIITVTATASSVVSSNQTVDLGVSGTNVTAGDYNLGNTTITIPSGQTTGTTTFTVVNDAVAEGTETATLTISNPSANIALGSTTTQNIAITDNDTASVNITQSSGSTNVSEGGATDSYTVVLNSQPTANVTITINPDSQSTSSATSLTFTSANWNTPQTVTVTAVNDNLVEGNHTSTISYTATSTDTNYNAI
ncbi:beta strand repeat-containing protein, partial [Kamptonema sp. PCC 6506]|uniref:beta strand repeat-containing protein n=2 Tax=Kamptonema TaxID=1501433 RepID=UPI000586F23C